MHAVFLFFIATDVIVKNLELSTILRSECCAKVSMCWIIGCAGKRCVAYLLTTMVLTVFSEHHFTVCGRAGHDAMFGSEGAADIQ